MRPISISLRTRLVEIEYLSTTMKITGKTVDTKKFCTVHVPRDGWDLWHSGLDIHDAMPEVPLKIRNFLLKGTSPE